MRRTRRGALPYLTRSKCWWPRTIIAIASSLRSCRPLTTSLRNASFLIDSDKAAMARSRSRLAAGRTTLVPGHVCAGTISRLRLTAQWRPF